MSGRAAAWRDTQVCGALWPKPWMRRSLARTAPTGIAPSEPRFRTKLPSRYQARPALTSSPSTPGPVARMLSEVAA